MIYDVFDTFNNTFSDEIKNEILNCDKTKLVDLSYNWNSKYKKYNSWFDDDIFEINDYLYLKGITKFQTEYILLSYKSYLSNNFNEKVELNNFLKTIIKYNYEEENRYILDTLNNIYIPTDLNDCYRKINEFWNDSTKAKLSKLTESEFSSRVHLNFGMWMRNNWQLWGGSRLSRYFTNQGIFHPDDMSGIITKGYYKIELKKEVFDLTTEINYYKKLWKNNKAIKSRTLDLEKFKTFNRKDTVILNYTIRSINQKDSFKFDKIKCTAKGIIKKKKRKYCWLKVELIENCNLENYFTNNVKYEIKSNDLKTWRNLNEYFKDFILKNKYNWFSYKLWTKN